MEDTSSRPPRTSRDAIASLLPARFGSRLALGAGAAAGIAALLVYALWGYSSWMLLLWLLAIAVLSLSFWSENRALPRIATPDLLIPAGLALLFAPLYVIGIYRWPVQVSGDEVAIIDVAKAYAHPHGADPFGVSYYLSRPTMLFIGWGKLGEWLGGFDLYHMRLLHALCGLVTIAAAYALFRQLLPRGWAVFASCVLGTSHAYFMISRLAMRENTSVLVEVLALALLLWGFRNEHLLATFWGGLLAGLGFYVYFPARVALPVWLAFLAAVALLRWVPPRKLALLGSVAVAGFVLMATPILIAESNIPPVAGPSDAEPQKSTLLIYSDAREKQRQWIGASSIREGLLKNISWGLTTFNNTHVDEGFIYLNPDHGFVDPLTGVLLWFGVGLVAYNLFRRRADDGALLVLVGFLALWLSFALVVNKAPNYTRLLVTLPFVAYLVTVAIRWIGDRWRRRSWGPWAVAGVALAGILAWNLAIGWDFIRAGRDGGDALGSTGRYVSAHDDSGERFYMATYTNGSDSYFSYGDRAAYLQRLRLFAADDAQVRGIVRPTELVRFSEPPPFALFMKKELWEEAAGSLKRRYPQGRIRNVVPDGSRVVLEVPE